MKQIQTQQRDREIKLIKELRDRNGKLIISITQEIPYDSWNRLIDVNDSTTKNIIEKYTYDHEGTRRKKITYNYGNNGHNKTTYYVGSRPVQFLHNRITNGTIFNETYIYLYDKLVSMIDNNGKKFFYHPDHLGSTSLVTNESGDVVENIAYYPFGGVLVGDVEDLNYLYTGKQRDKFKSIK